MFCGGQPVPVLLLFHRSMGCPQWVMKAIESCKLGALGGHPEFQISIWDPRGHHNRRALLRDSCFVYFLRPFRFRCCFVKFGSLRETLKRTSLTKLSPAFPQLLSVANSFATLLFATLPFRYWRDAACCISVVVSQFVLKKEHCPQHRVGAHWHDLILRYLWDAALHISISETNVSRDGCCEALISVALSGGFWHCNFWRYVNFQVIHDIKWLPVSFLFLSNTTGTFLFFWINCRNHCPRKKSFCLAKVMNPVPN